MPRNTTGDYDPKNLAKFAGESFFPKDDSSLSLTGIGSSAAEQESQKLARYARTEQEAFSNWIDEYKAKKAFDVPLDPHLFYRRLGLIRHPETRKLIPQLAKFQYDIWKSMLANKYTICIKSQKTGITTSVLMCDFQKAILPPSDPRSCMGHEILIVGQSLDIARQHIYTLKQMIMASDSYSPYLIQRPTRWLSKDEVSKVNRLYLHNPFDTYHPTRVIGLGPKEAGLWSWKSVKHIHLSDIAIVHESDQQKTIDAALSRLANTDGTMIIESPPRGPFGKVYEIWQKSRQKTDIENPEGQFNPIRVHYSEAVRAHIIKKEKIDEYKVQFGRTFAMYFEAQFIASGGDVFDIKDIERAEILGRSVNIDKPNPYSPTIIAVDPGFGSSKFAVVAAQLNNKRIEIVYAEEFETSTPSEMFRLVYDLAIGFYANNVYVDASNPGMVRELKFMFNDNPEQWQDLVRQAKESGLAPDYFMKVVPINFGTDGKAMLFHAQKCLHLGQVAINPEYDKLLAQMRSAQEIRGNLDKSRHSLDLIDALRMCLYFFKVEKKEKQE